MMSASLDTVKFFFCVIRIHKTQQFKDLSGSLLTASQTLPAAPLPVVVRVTRAEYAENEFIPNQREERSVADDM